MRPRLEQLGGLAVDDFQITGFAGLRVVAVEQLHDFAFGDGIGGVGQHLHDAHAANVDHHLECAGIQKVADQDAGFVTPDGIGGFVAAAQFRGVHHIVMQQGGGVNEFDDGGQVDVAPALITAGRSRQQHDHGPDTLAAAIDDVVAELVDQSDIGVQGAADQGVDLSHVLGDEFAYCRKFNWVLLLRQRHAGGAPDCDRDCVEPSLSRVFYAAAKPQSSQKQSNPLTVAR